MIISDLDIDPSETVRCSAGHVPRYEKLHDWGAIIDFTAEVKGSKK